MAAPRYGTVLELALVAGGILVQTNQSLTLATLDCSVVWSGGTPNSPSPVATMVPVEASNVVVTLYAGHIVAHSLTVRRGHGQQAHSACVWRGGVQRECPTVPPP